MKYGLIREGKLIQTAEFDDVPTIAQSKGRWLQVVEDTWPEITDDQTVDTSESEVNGTWYIAHTVRDKTELEKWEYPEHCIKIIAPLALIDTNDGMAIVLWFNVNELPIKKKGDMVHLYCDVIEEKHRQLVDNLYNEGIITAFIKVDNEVTELIIESNTN